jgi:hypothetical protein
MKIETLQIDLSIFSKVEMRVDQFLLVSPSLKILNFSKKAGYREDFAERKKKSNKNWKIASLD